MTAILYSTDPSSIAAFIIFTLILGFLGGWATGRAFAGTWRSPIMLIPAVLLLGAAVRFLHYAIAGEDLTSVYYYVESTVIVALGAVYGFRSCRSDQMARQYSWLYAKAGAMGWAAKSST